MAWRALVAGTTYSLMGLPRARRISPSIPGWGLPTTTSTTSSTSRSGRAMYLRAIFSLRRPASWGSGACRLRSPTSMPNCSARAAVTCRSSSIPGANKQLAEAQPRFRLVGQDLIELLLGDQLLLEQDRAESGPRERCLRVRGRRAHRLRSFRWSRPRWAAGPTGNAARRARRVTPPRFLRTIRYARARGCRGWPAGRQPR